MNRLSRWWPALAWAAVIFLFSTGMFTSENTGRFIIPILHWLLPHAALDTLFKIHYYIRKCGHFTEYFILSWLLLRGIRAGRPETHLKWALLVIILAGGYASLDEFHQSFVPGRTAAVSDVFLDTTGGATAQVIAALVLLGSREGEERKNKA